MRKLLGAVTALSIAAATPALAGNGNHNGGWNGGHRWNGSAWVLAGPLLGAAVIGSILAAPYYGFGGYGYPSYYSYPTPLVPPQPRWCQGPYGPYQC